MEIGNLPQAHDLRNLAHAGTQRFRGELFTTLREPGLAFLFAKPIFADTGFYVRKPEADYAISAATQPDRIEKPSVLSALDSHDRDSEELCDLFSV